MECRRRREESHSFKKGPIRDSSRRRLQLNPRRRADTRSPLVLSGVCRRVRVGITPTMTSPTNRPRVFAAACLSFWLVLSGIATAQTVFLDFNTVGQYTNNFNPWNDNGGLNGGNYSFTENLTAGVSSSGGVSVLQNGDTTATYKSGSWDFSTNHAALTLSVMIKANGMTSGNKVQFGIVNSTTNGLNSNAGVAFESFRLIPNG